MGATRRGGLAATVLGLGLTVALVAAACTKDEPPPTANVGGTTPVVTAAKSGGGTLRLGVTRSDSLDPAAVVPTVQSDMVSIDLLFDGLTAIDPATSEAEPALAKDIAHDDSLTTWTFTLRPDATFSDGTPVTAADVKFSLERIVSKGAASLSAGPLEVIQGYGDLAGGKAPELTGVKVVDDHTVTISTVSPFASLPELLASPVFGIVSKAAVDQLKADFGQKPVGSGPFAFVSQDDTSVTLKKAAASKAQLDGIVLMKFPDKAAALQALRDGTVDWAGVPSGQTVADAEKVGVVQQGSQSAENFFAINVANPKFANVKFRQAIVKAIDRKKIATESEHSTMPLNGVVPPKQPGGSADPCGDACAFDVEGAKALLKEAFPDGNVPTVELDYQTGTSVEDAAQQKAAEQIQADLAAAGIPVTPAPKPFEEYRSFPHSGNGEIFSYGWVGLSPDPEAYLAPLFVSTSGNNVTAFRDPAVDDAIGKARATPDRASRIEQYRAIEKQVMAQVPIIPIAVIDLQVIVSPKVTGYAARFDGTFDAEAVGISA